MRPVLRHIRNKIFTRPLTTAGVLPIGNNPAKQAILFATGVPVAHRSMAFGLPDSSRQQRTRQAGKKDHKILA